VIPQAILKNVMDPG